MCAQPRAMGLVSCVAAMASEHGHGVAIVPRKSNGWWHRLCKRAAVAMVVGGAPSPHKREGNGKVH